MPFYTFENKKSGKQFTKEMTNKEREEYLEKHKNIIQVITKMTTVDPVRIGVTKPPADFQKHIIGGMKARIPQNNINKKGRFDIPREF